MNLPTPDSIREKVREVYARAAEPKGESCGCNPGSCCGTSATDAGSIATSIGYGREELGALPEGANLGLGCGNPLAIASLREGETVVDLGSGAGIDCFLSARKVGPTGKVIGIDMTASMITKARENARTSGVANVEFRLGEIENLPIADATVDVLISNCVINLSPEKPKVLAEAFRILKPGGRIAFSDVVALEPVSADLRADLDLHSACVSGAMEVSTWRAALVDAGFTEALVEVQEGSSALVDGWTTAVALGGRFASARITAVKPGVP